MIFLSTCFSLGSYGCQLLELNSELADFRGQSIGPMIRAIGHRLTPKGSAGLYVYPPATLYIHLTIYFINQVNSD
jgi:hypothetical protein